MKKKAMQKILAETTPNCTTPKSEFNFFTLEFFNKIVILIEGLTYFLINFVINYYQRSYE